MLEFFHFLWDTVSSFLLLLRDNLSFDLGSYSVSYFDIIFVLMFVYLIFKYFVFRH